MLSGIRVAADLRSAQVNRWGFGEAFENGRGGDPRAGDGDYPANCARFARSNRRLITVIAQRRRRFEIRGRGTGHLDDGHIARAQIFVRGHDRQGNALRLSRIPLRNGHEKHDYLFACCTA